MARSSSWRSYRPGAASASGAASSRRGARVADAEVAFVPYERTGPVRVLGLDPGSQNTGFGLVETSASGTRYLASGAIRAGSGEFAERLRVIHAGIAALVAEHRPHEIAVERVFVHRNPDSALKLGQARGAALSATFGCGATLHEYSPREVKLAVVGTGAADKVQVQAMIKALLSLTGRLGADAADALAIAVCHAHVRASALALGARVRR